MGFLIRTTFSFFGREDLLCSIQLPHNYYSLMNWYKFKYDIRPNVTLVGLSIGSAQDIYSSSFYSKPKPTFSI